MSQNIPLLECEDKESEEYCAEVDCQNKKMAKKCMMTCEMCHDNHEDDGKPTSRELRKDIDLFIKGLG